MMQASSGPQPPAATPGRLNGSGQQTPKAGAGAATTPGQPKPAGPQTPKAQGAGPTPGQQQLGQRPQQGPPGPQQGPGSQMGGPQGGAGAQPANNGPQPQRPPTQQYGQPDAKMAYAHKVRPGEQPNLPAYAGVQRASEPVREAGDPAKVNTGLEEENPNYARAMGDMSRLMSNIDHSSFARDAFNRGSMGPGGMGSMMGIRGSMYMGPGMGSMYGMGAPMGSMYGMGGPMMGGGSMYGMGGPMMGGSMYGMNPMMGSMYGMSQPASLFGSQYGMGGMGSMYGPMGGSMYGMGMGGPMGGSMYGMGGPVGGSMYGMGAPGGFGSMYNNNNQGAASQYQMPGSMANADAFYSAPGQPQQPNGAAPGQPQQQPGQQPPPPQQQQPGQQPAAQQSRALPQLGAQTPASQYAAGLDDTSKGGRAKAEPVPGIVMLVQPAQPSPMASVNADATRPNTLVVAGPPPSTMQLDELVVADPAPGAQMAAWKSGATCKAFLHHVVAGHNTALLVARGPTAEEANAAQEFVRTAVQESMARLEGAASEDQANGYYDVHVYCVAVQSANSVLDLVENSKAPKPVQVGSNPIFGPAFLDMKDQKITSQAQGMPILEGLITKAFDPAVQASSPVVVLQLVTKQVRTNPKNPAEKDVLLASVLICISHRFDGENAFFAGLRNEQTVPSGLTKVAIGGCSSSFAVLCLSTGIQGSVAGAITQSLTDMRAVQNPPPRSGNVARFNQFAQAEATKLKARPDADAAVKAKVELMLSDSEKLMKDPKNQVPKGYPGSAQMSRPGSAQGGPAASRGVAAPAAGGDEKGEGKADGSNPVRTALVVFPQANNGLPPTFTLDAASNTLTSTASNAQCTVDEMVQLAPEEWNAVSSAKQVSDLQALFQNGNNTALIGTVSPNEVNTLDKQPLWLSYKRMVSSLLSVATQKYVFAEVSIAVTLIDGMQMLSDLLLINEQPNAAPQAPKKLTIGLSPLFGPTVYKATTIKPPTPLQLESAINSALFNVPGLLERYPGQHPIIFASAVMKGVTKDDVFTSSLLGASTTNPQVFLDILDKKPDTPHELFDYALGGPCCTVFFGDVVQGDSNVDSVVQLVNRLKTTQNRAVRSCSVNKFVTFASENLKRADEKLAKATTEKEKESIMKNRKSMEAFYTEYKALAEDPEHRDPKAYRKGGSSKDDGAAAAGAKSAGAPPAAARSADKPAPAAGAPAAPAGPSGAPKKKDDGADDSTSQNSRHSRTSKGSKGSARKGSAHNAAKRTNSSGSLKRTNSTGGKKRDDRASQGSSGSKNRSSSGKKDAGKKDAGKKDSDKKDAGKKAPAKK